MQRLTNRARAYMAYSSSCNKWIVFHTKFSKRYLQSELSSTTDLKHFTGPLTKQEYTSLASGLTIKNLHAIEDLLVIK